MNLKALKMNIIDFFEEKKTESVREQMTEEGIRILWEEIKGEWNIFCKEELKDLYKTPNLIRAIKLK